MIVWLKGSYCYVVREITDILDPRSVAASQSFRSPQFVSATEISFVDGQLIKMRLNGPHTVVPNSGSPFAWSPDGSSVAYLTGTAGTGVADVYLNGGGQSRKLDSVPAPRGGIGCESRTCGDTWDVRMMYSPNGAYISLNYVPGVGVFRIWTADGKALKSMDSSSATMSVWSGDALYWRDDKGVQKWQAGQQSLVLPGVSWIRPHASPAGGQIVYETRDAGGGKSHVNLLDTATGKTRELKALRSEPALLNSHLIWFKEERSCAPADVWPCSTEATTIETGKTYILDLQDNTESESVIAAVFDVWPHPA